MIKPSVRELMDKTDCRYSLVCAVAKRAREIVDGSERKMVVNSNKPVTIAVWEIDDAKVLCGEPAEIKLEEQKQRAEEQALIEATKAEQTVEEGDAIEEATLDYDFEELCQSEQIEEEEDVNA